MEMVFTADISLGIFKEALTLEKNLEIKISQTVPFIPTAKQLEMYADAIRTNLEPKGYQITNVHFTRYDRLEPVDLKTIESEPKNSDD